MTKTTPKLDAENLTPSQKAAATRAKNKAAKAAAEPQATTGEIAVHGSEAAAAAVTIQLPPVVQVVVDEIDRAAESEYVQVTASKVTPKIGAKARDVIYTIGIVLGAIGAAGAPVVAILTGDAQIVAASVVGIALSLTNLLAKLNLSKTAADINKEAATA